VILLQEKISRKLGIHLATKSTASFNLVDGKIVFNLTFGDVILSIQHTH
jgi:hypothetical protein